MRKPLLPSAGRPSGLILTTLLLGFQPLAAQTSRVWNGGTADFLSPTDWTPEGSPANEDPVEINAGQLSHAGNFNRAAQTVLAGSATLSVDNGRFYNASGGLADTLISGEATLNHTGQFFIAAHNNPGTVLQTGGTVNSSVTEAFYLADGANAKGLYELTGGMLSVTLSGTSALDRQIHLGKQALGDLMRIDGGTANFFAASASRRFYVSRNAELRIDSGTVNADGFQYFLIGREGVANTNALLTVNGGELNITGIPSGGAFIVGAGHDGLFRMSGGTVNATSSNLWMGDGRTGTVIHTGGTLDLGPHELILARTAAGSGQYQLDGGTLKLRAITPGPGLFPRFVFRSGTVMFSGDQRGVVNEPWFAAASPVTAEYDDSQDLTTLTAAPVEGKDAQFRYLRFTPGRLRDGFATAVQLSGLEFYRDGLPLDLSGAVAENPGGVSTPGEDPANLLDHNPATKWLDSAGQPVIIDFGSPAAFDSYRLVTANDVPGRDPLRWTLEGSPDGMDWTPVDRQVADYPVPAGRFVESVPIPLPQTVPVEPPPPVALTWTGSVSAAWDTTARNWMADGAPVLWTGNGLENAVFAGSPQKTVDVTAPVTAAAVRFPAGGYRVQGTETLTLVDPAVVSADAGAVLAVPLAGTGGLRKEGPGQVTLEGTSTLTGPTAVTDGILTFSGESSSSGNGNLYLADREDSRALVEIGTMGQLDFSGSVRLGTGDRSAAGVVQTSGTVNLGGPSVQYLELGGGIATPTGSWGGWHLAGGSLNTVAGADPSGIRVGNEGLGTWLQTGGMLNCARWFAIGGNDGLNGEGEATFLGGTAVIAPGYRILLGDRPSTAATLNLGTLAGGDAHLTTINTAGLAVGANGTAASAVLNLNRGTLVLGGPLFKAAGSVMSQVNFNGATLQPGGANVDLLNDTLNGAAFLHQGGLTVDTAGNDALLTGSLMSPSGSGVYPEGGGFTVSDGGSGYLGAPLVTVFASVGGFFVDAVAEVQDGSVRRVLITSPGQGLEAGETLTFQFQGGGPLTPAAEFQHVLTTADLQPQGGGGLVKTGEGRLTISGSVNTGGPTEVRQGILEANGILEGTALTVAPDATLTGNLNTSGPVTVEGTLAPGILTGTAQGFGQITLAAGAVFAVDLADWTGVPGEGWDVIHAGSLAIQATAARKLTVRLDASLLANFDGSARTFLLAGATGGITGLQADNWQIEASGFPGSGTWALASEGTRELVLKYTPAGGASAFDSWITGYPGLSATGPLADPDRDGVVNLLEYILNSHPGQSGSAGSLGLSAQSAPQGYVFSFVRRVESKNDTIQTFQHSAALGSGSAWTSVVLPAASTGHVVIQPVAGFPALETVTITLPSSAASDGRLFGRLSAVRK